MIHDMGVPLFSQSLDLCMQDLFQVYLEMANDQELKIRIYACVPLEGSEDLRAFIEREGRHHPSQMLFWGCVKEFYDGSLGSETALMHQPYEGSNDNAGIRIHEREVLAPKVAKAQSDGMHVIMHAIGDRAVDEGAEVLLGKKGRGRHRLEHVQHISGQDTLEVLKQGQILAVVNPLHLLDDANMMLEKLGRERSGKSRSYAYKSMVVSNVTVAFGSDWPLVAPLEPLGSILAATERVPTGKTEAFVPEEALSREEALVAATRSASFASFTENINGRLLRGLKADFVVLDRDLFTSKDKPTVLRTYINGEMMYKKADV